jgi:hypothetical protein
MENTLADDLMVGIKPISEFLGLTQRQTFYLAQTRQLPVFKLGTKWAGRRSTLIQAIVEREKASQGAA